MACVSTAATVTFACSPVGGNLYKDNVLWISNAYSQFSNCVTAGYHTFRYELSGYRASETQSYNYPAGVETEIDFILEPDASNGCTAGKAKIVFTYSPMYGTLYEDGDPIGNPATICIPSGYHTFKYEKSGYTTQETNSYNYLAGETYPVYFNLPPTCTNNTTRCSPENTKMVQKCVSGTWVDQPPECTGSCALGTCSAETPCEEDASVYVTISPTYSSIFIDGYEFKTNIGAGGVQVCLGYPGTYNIEYRHDGYVTQYEYVAITSPSMVLSPRNITLVPTSGSKCPAAGDCAASLPGEHCCSNVVDYYECGSDFNWIYEGVCPVAPTKCPASGDCVASLPGQHCCSNVVDYYECGSNLNWIYEGVCPTAACNATNCPLPKKCVNNVCITPTCTAANCALPKTCVNDICTSPTTCNSTNCALPKTCVNNICTSPPTCSPACILPEVCNSTTHKCSLPGETPCVGLNRNGEFDFSCLLDEQNRMLLLGIGVLGLVLLMRK